MNPATLKAAVKEAKRFIDLASEVETHKTGEYEYINSGKASGAVKRASMDLSRALSEMRKPG